MAFKATILTLYPDMFPGPLGHSLSGRALDKGLWQLETCQIRDHATDKHRSVDDTPAGGGAGMVLRADILGKAIDAAAAGRRPAPQAPDESARQTPFTQKRAHAAGGRPGRRDRLRPL